LAEYRIRRHVRRLETVEARLSDARITAAFRAGLSEGADEHDRREVSSLEGEIAELESKLRTLIVASEEGQPA
jgi:transcription elongation GreA/GreB family factor